ncbi:MAG: NUDIX domain-containing protein [Planctomycetaceae bacterium]|nr:NUDIX domain-containing protein [Planctomycetales bacterium]MCB9926527.1 NUDIX domain-containing protein [Planctomycetaceae bacterium]
MFESSETTFEHPRRGVVAVVPRQGRLLVIRRSEFVVAPGAYCFPGGGIHENEGEVAAIVREMQEELGVAATARRLLWRSVTPWNVELAWWLVDLPSECILAANEAEVASIHWHTPAEIRLLSNLLESNHDFLDAWQRSEFHLSLD